MSAYIVLYETVGGEIQVVIENETGSGYRLFGPGFDGTGRRVGKRELNKRDREEVRRRCGETTHQVLPLGGVHIYPDDLPDMICEEHPASVWPHGDCLGPGMPPENIVRIWKENDDR